MKLVTISDFAQKGCLEYSYSRNAVSTYSHARLVGSWPFLANNCGTLRKLWALPEGNQTQNTLWVFFCRKSKLIQSKRQLLSSVVWGPICWATKNQRKHKLAHWEWIHGLGTLIRYPIWLVRDQCLDKPLSYLLGWRLDIAQWRATRMKAEFRFSNDGHLAFPQNIPGMFLQSKPLR